MPHLIDKVIYEEIFQSIVHKKEHVIKRSFDKNFKSFKIKNKILKKTLKFTCYLFDNRKSF